MRSKVKSAAVCPKCGSEEFYANAYPTGRRMNGSYMLVIPNDDEGHCLSCDYYAPFTDEAREEARAL